ncbi:alpha/beta fold hydrolase [Acinetobacter sp. EC24]|nr:alpha/beta fold hydrolase [Acinetobacter rathckeae]MBF7695306.1 alpha/beta fold hydrolase [Acinetobacter rathckeae]
MKIRLSDFTGIYARSVLSIFLLAITAPTYAKVASSNNISIEPNIHWQSCRSDQFTHWFDEKPPRNLRCGFLDVPLAYSQSSLHPSQRNTRRVKLALTLLPATKVKKGSLVMISGGPGESGINPSLGEDPSVRKLRESYDIIGYDPRGVGESIPRISCEVNATSEQQLKYNDDIADAERQTRNLISSCIQQTGADVLQHIGTEEAVNDLDMIRQALNEPKLTAVAYSYGTKVAALYAEKFPEKTRALVLDGVVDLAEDDFTQRLNQEKAFKQGFKRFARYCEKTTHCAISGKPDQAIQQYQMLLRHLHDHPLIAEDGYEITADKVLNTTYSLLVLNDRWSDLVMMLSDISDGIASQELSDLIQEYNSEDVDSTLSVITCADVSNPSADINVLRKQRQEINKASQFADYLPNHKYPLEMCDLWPYRGKDKPHTPVASSALPKLLFVAQRYDPTTPYRNAEVMAKAFNSYLITRENDGHTFVLSDVDPCIDKKVVNYLLYPEKILNDKTCN